MLSLTRPSVCQNTVGKMAIFNLYTRKYLANDK